MSEPQKLLPYLLQPSVNDLPADTIAVYVQAITKVFGLWAAELAQNWDDDSLPEVRQLVDSILSRVRELAGSRFIEVQERVSIQPDFS